MKSSSQGSNVCRVLINRRWKHRADRGGGSIRLLALIIATQKGACNCHVKCKFLGIGMWSRIVGMIAVWQEKKCSWRETSSVGTISRFAANLSGLWQLMFSGLFFFSWCCINMMNLDVIWKLSAVAGVESESEQKQQNVKYSFNYQNVI